MPSDMSKLLKQIEDVQRLEAAARIQADVQRASEIEASQQAYKAIAENHAVLKAIGASLGNAGSAMAQSREIAKKLGAAADSQKLAAIGASLSATSRDFGRIGEGAAKISKIFDSANFYSRMNIADFSRFTRPDLGGIFAFAEKANALLEPIRRLDKYAETSRRLTEKLEAIGKPWAYIEAPEYSVVGFAQLSRFGGLITRAQPYDSYTRETVDEELGSAIDDVADYDSSVHEARYDAAGRNPALVAFPIETYPEVVTAAGLGLRIPAPPQPAPIENIEPVWFDNEPQEPTIRAVELHLRAFIVEQLSKAGPRWLRQKIPPALRKEWEERRETDRNLRRPVFELIHYADLGHLEQIIVEGANWRDTFKPFFREPAMIITSFRRLTPIRNASAHNRPLTQSDLLTVAAEAVCLLRAMGVM